MTRTLVRPHSQMPASFSPSLPGAANAVTMPRHSSGGRSAPHPAPRAAPVRNPPHPASHVPPPAPAQSGGGSILGGIGSTIARDTSDTVLKSDTTTQVAEKDFVSHMHKGYYASPSGVSSRGNILSSIKRNGQPTTVSLVNSVVKESNGVGSSKVDIVKETKESSAFDPKFQVTTVSQCFSVSSPHFEPSNKQQHGLPVKAAGPVKGYCYATPFSSYAHQLYPQSRSSNAMLAARRWQDNDNFKTRSKISQSGESNWINERTRGRGLLASRTSTEKDNVNSMIKRDQYNRPDFETEYNDALFFVIKSFSEDDIHKCIKYKVWASTQAGNKKLDAAYHYAQERSNETGSKCPVFLFFSVNGSGQFVGLAEMTGPVDFKKTMDFWQQDRWTGFFPVKWHIIKDIYNNHLRHIILENNDNKPVTNSRDTQEIKLKQGCEMLAILKSFTAKSSLLDDFLFYEEGSFHNEKETRRLGPVTEGEDNIVGSKDGFDTNMSLNVGKPSHSPKQSLLDLARSLSLNSQSADNNRTAKDLIAA